MAWSRHEWDFEGEKLDDSMAEGGTEAALESERRDGFLIGERKRREPLHHGE